MPRSWQNPMISRRVRATEVAVLASAFSFSADVSNGSAVGLPRQDPLGQLPIHRSDRALPPLAGLVDVADSQPFTTPINRIIAVAALPAHGFHPIRLVWRRSTSSSLR